MGWQDPWVHYHNRIAAHVAAIAREASRLGIYWVIEQPGNSVLFDLPLLQAIMVSTHALSVTLNLADFGATSLKPLHLVGTAPWLLALPLDTIARRQHLQCLSTRDAGGRVTGTRFKSYLQYLHPCADVIQ